jgi:hypothetical protein
MGGSPAMPRMPSVPNKCLDKNQNSIKRKVRLNLLSYGVGICLRQLVRQPSA